MSGYDNVLIELENGVVIEYSVMAIFEVAWNSYVALLPTDINNSDEIVFYGCNENVENKSLELFVIEDDDEFSVVSAAFIKLMEDFAIEQGQGQEQE